MIQKGIIEQVIDKYNYKIRIPKYDKIESATSSTKTDDLASGIVCTMPGIDIAYSLGDIVLVSFENDEISKPIILGLLYRDSKSGSDISVSNVDDSLTSIKEEIDKLNATGIYTHIKYSNDNGLTFTSLFNNINYETVENGQIVCRPYFDPDSGLKGIKIDKTTRVINWSIINDLNNDITREINLETTIFDSNDNIISSTTNEYNIVINNVSGIDGDLFLTYKLYVSKEYLDTIHVSLTTDKTLLGDAQGEYIGLNVSDNPLPSVNPSDYRWFSFNAALQEYLTNLSNKLEIDVNSKILELKENLDDTYTTIYYKEVSWTQSEVDVYCKIGYQNIWTRDYVDGYSGEVKEGNILYITVHNTGDPSIDTVDPNTGITVNNLSDDSYGRLEIKALSDALPSEPVLGQVIYYDRSGEVSIDALVRFKNSLLAPGDETLINGGHITTNTIQANKLNIGEYMTFTYTKALLAQKPDDWETNWTNYYRASSDGYGFTKITDAECPVWTGEYFLSTDTTVQSDKTYYIRTGSGTIEDPYSYTAVSNPTGSPVGQGWYELQGQFFEDATNKPQLILGNPYATGSSNDNYYILMDNERIAFYYNKQQVASIDGDKMIIPRSIMMEEMRVGATNRQWSWREHDGNLQLKWIGGTE